MQCGVLEGMRRKDKLLDQAATVEQWAQHCDPMEGQDVVGMLLTSGGETITAASGSLEAVEHLPVGCEQATSRVVARAAQVWGSTGLQAPLGDSNQQRTMDAHEAASFFPSAKGVYCQEYRAGSPLSGDPDDGALPMEEVVARWRADEGEIADTLLLRRLCDPLINLAIAGLLPRLVLPSRVYPTQSHTWSEDSPPSSQSLDLVAVGSQPRLQPPVGQTASGIQEALGEATSNILEVIQMGGLSQSAQLLLQSALRGLDGVQDNITRGRHSRLGTRGKFLHEYKLDSLLFADHVSGLSNAQSALGRCQVCLMSPPWARSASRWTSAACYLPGSTFFITTTPPWPQGQSGL